mgnify:FL=1
MVKLTYAGMLIGSYLIGCSQLRGSDTPENSQYLDTITESLLIDENFTKEDKVEVSSTYDVTERELKQVITVDLKNDGIADYRKTSRIKFDESGSLLEKRLEIDYHANGVINIRISESYERGELRVTSYERYDEQGNELPWE